MSNTSDGKYDKILRASIETISEKGLENTSISDIVKKAGVAQGTFYLYFSSKNALIPAIADNLVSITLESIQNRVQEEDHFWEVLDVLIDETLRITDTHKDIIILCYSGLALDHSMEKWESIYQPYYNWVEGVLNNAIRNKEIISNINVRWTAKTIINLIEHVAERFYIGNEQEDDIDAFKKEAFDFIKRSLIKP